MKKLLKHLLPIVSILSVIVCCTPEDLLIEVQPAERQLAISSQIVPGRYMFVTVTRSFSALEGNEDTLSDEFLNTILVDRALVRISWETGETTLEQLEDVPGFYASTEPLDSNAVELRLDVYDSLTGISVYAETQILPQIKLDSMRFIEEIVDEDTVQQVYFGFNEPSETDNWYVLNAFDPVEYAESLENNPFTYIDGSVDAFIDRLITDQTFDTTYYQRTHEYHGKFDNLISSDTVVLFFSNISEEYFRFLDARRRTGGIISSATSEPINHPTNVVGGLGFFNAHWPSVALVPKEALYDK